MRLFLAGRATLAVATAFAAAFAFAACNADSSVSAGIPTGPTTVSSVLVLGLPDTLASGDVFVFGVRVLDQDGRDVIGRQVKLASSNPAVAVIDPSGRARAVGAGETTISASVDGVVGTASLVVSGGPAELHLRLVDGQSAPAFVEADSVALPDGVVEHYEIYLESGILQLSGGASPAYHTTLHYAIYEVTLDDAGQRRLTFHFAEDITDNGAVQYDARGDLLMTSAKTESITHAAGVESAGFTMRYELVPNDAVPRASFFFRREPK
jgi:hypothetical protein